MALTSVQQDPQEKVAAQRNKALVEKYIDDAETLRRQGHLEAARLQILKAKDREPANKQVQSILRMLNIELKIPGGSADNFAVTQLQLEQINSQRRKSEVSGLIDSGRQSIDAKDFGRAISVLRRAVLNVEIGSNISWGELETQARELLAEAESTQEAYERDRERQISAEIEGRRMNAEAATEARRKNQVNDLISKASRAYQQKRFKLSQDLAYEAMRRDQNNAMARNLHNAAMKSQRDSTTETYYKEMAREIRKLKEAGEALRIPQTDIIVMDDETTQRALARSYATLPTAQVDPDNLELRTKLASSTLSGLAFTEDNGSFDDVKTRINAITNIPIIITPEARETIDGEGLTIVMELTAPMSVANFLTLMVQKSENLAWTVNNAVVEITTKAKAGGDNTHMMHDVRDLIFAKTQFLAPQIRDIPTGDDDSETPRTGGEGEEKTFFVEMDGLVSNIKDATDPNYWDTEGGGVVDQVEQGYLFVIANPQMQARVRRILEDMRSFATEVVTIESKFLQIQQNYLQEVGVDWRGLGGAGSKGDVAQLDDITNGLDDNSSRGVDNSGTSDPAGNPSSGAFFNDGADGDIRGRTENFFPGNPLGNALSSTGGMTAALVYLDDLQLQMIIRAVEKKQDVQELNGQTLTVLNNERGHVAIINQTAYIRDFDVEVAQAAFIADPKVDVIQDGVVLDVKPTILFDRKHITLDMTPTVAELVRPIPTFSTSLAGTTQPVTIQLPVLSVRSFATVATVPDGGSVLIGGLREVMSVERRAEVPLFAKIPLLGFFFKQEGVSNEKSSLMVLIRASITDTKHLVSGG